MPSKLQLPEAMAELWEKFLTAKLDDRGAEKLTSWFKTHPAELECCRRDAAVSQALTYLFQPDSSRQRFAESIQSRLIGKKAGQDSGKLKRNVMEQLHSLRPARKHRRVLRKAAPAFNWLYAAAILLALTGAAWLLVSYGQSKPAQKVAEKQVPPPPITPVPAPAVASNKLRLENGTGSIDNRPISSAQPVDVKPGSSIELESDARGTLTLTDGSTLKLIDQTTLKLSGVDHGAFLRLDCGRVEVHAQHQEHGDKLVIETPHASVSVVGTEYAVDALSDRSHVAVQNGTVSVAPSGKNNIAAQPVSIGEELWADNSGLGSIRTANRRRVLSARDIAIEEFSDPVTSSLLSDVSFGDLPVCHFSYEHPRGKAKWYGGVYWPVKLAAEENQYEIWVRPKSVKLGPKFQSLMLFILLQLGDTEYAVGKIEIKPGEKGWRVLSGRTSNAEVNWVRPGTKQLPARADLAERLALRVCNGDIEFDYTPMIVWK
jgi:ferric-dicitrate binding protein FerR (iron transport regulator)